MACIGHIRAALALALLLGSLGTLLVPAEPARANDCPDLKVTGGGWIPVADGRATFGFNAQRRTIGNPCIVGPDVTGQLQFHHHPTGFRVHVTEIDVLVVERNTAYFEGPVMIDGVPDRCRVRVTDNDLKGQDRQLGGPDTFWIQCDNNLPVEAPLGGGNITIHSGPS